MIMRGLPHYYVNCGSTAAERFKKVARVALTTSHAGVAYPSAFFFFSVKNKPAREATVAAQGFCDTTEYNLR